MKLVTIVLDKDGKRLERIMLGDLDITDSVVATSEGVTVNWNHLEPYGVVSLDFIVERVVTP